MYARDPRKLLEELLKLLKLEKIEENIFRGKSQDLGFGNIFGGQVLGQALSAAGQTVTEERSAHSLHAYFLLPGDPAMPIIYDVDCIRDGRSFTTRRVKAIQKGRAIFNLSASFQVDEPGFDHQDELPDVPGPEGIRPELEMARELRDRIPEHLRAKLLCDRPIEIRPIDPVNPFAPKKKPPVRYTWIRANGRLPDDLTIHQCMLAYASDFGMVATSMLPHGQTFWKGTMQVASLDHAMWFHRPFRMDDWLLHAMKSPSASNARGVTFGRVFTQDGLLVATTSQEGLIRYRKRKK